jgi:hypothetical protein
MVSAKEAPVLRSGGGPTNNDCGGRTDHRQRRGHGSRTGLGHVPCRLTRGPYRLQAILAASRLRWPVQAARRYWSGGPGGPRPRRSCWRARARRYPRSSRSPASYGWPPTPPQAPAAVPGGTAGLLGRRAPAGPAAHWPLPYPGAPHATGSSRAAAAGSSTPPRCTNTSHAWAPLRTAVSPTFRG